MKKTIQASVGLIIGLVMVWFLFRGTEWGAVLDSIQSMSLGWLLIVLIPIFLSFFVRVQRWTYIVRAAQPVSFRTLFSATQIGFLANFTLPLRAGEAIRALVLTRLTSIPFPKSFAMVALDRVTDLFGLVVVMIVALAAFQPTTGVSIPAETFDTENAITFSIGQYRAGAVGAGLFIVIVVAAFVLLYIRRSLILRLSDTITGAVSKALATRIHGILDHFADGMHIFRSPADMAKSLFFSLLTWGCSLVFFVGMMEAFHIDYPWYTPFVIQSILTVFISLPGAPGFVGQFHIPIVITLVMLIPDIDVSQAKAMAIMAHLFQLPFIGFFGVYCLMREDLHLLALRTEGEQLTSKTDTDNADRTSHKED